MNPLDQAISGLEDAIKKAKGHPVVPTSLQSLLIGLKAMLDCDERPCWLKSADGRMLYLNPAYTKVFGKTYDDYGGQPDDVPWGKVVGSKYSENDLKVIGQGRAIVFREKVPMPSGKSQTFRIEKWPVYLEGELIGVAGASLGAA